MTTVLHACSYGRFIEIQSKAPIFLEQVLVIEIMLEPQSNLEEKDKSAS